MPDDLYPVELDQNTGRAFVDVTGAVNTDTIVNTLLTILSNDTWQQGDRSILWCCEYARFPGAFSFVEVLNTTRTTRFVSGAGKSAFLLEENPQTAEMITDYYENAASSLPERAIEIFYSQTKAIRWLNNI